MSAALDRLCELQHHDIVALRDWCTQLETERDRANERLRDVLQVMVIFFWAWRNFDVDTVADLADVAERETRRRVRELQRETDA